MIQANHNQGMKNDFCIHDFLLFKRINVWLWFVVAVVVVGVDSEFRVVQCYYFHWSNSFWFCFDFAFGFVSCNLSIQ